MTVIPQQTAGVRSVHVNGMLHSGIVLVVFTDCLIQRVSLLVKIVAHAVVSMPQLRTVALLI